MSTNVGGLLHHQPRLHVRRSRHECLEHALRGWLDENRVWKPLFENFGSQDVVLRPLHRRDCADTSPLSSVLTWSSIGREKWDAGLQGGAGILIHRFKLDNVLCHGSPASVELISPFAAHPQKVGETFQVGDESNVVHPSTVARSSRSTTQPRTATIRLANRPAAEIPGPHQRPFDIGLIGSDAGGISTSRAGWFTGSRRTAPFTRIVQQINAYSDAVSIRDTGVRSLAQADALTCIIRHAAEALRAPDPVRTPSLSSHPSPKIRRTLWPINRHHHQESYPRNWTKPRTNTGS